MSGDGARRERREKNVKTNQFTKNVVAAINFSGRPSDTLAEYQRHFLSRASCISIPRARRFRALKVQENRVFAEINSPRNRNDIRASLKYHSAPEASDRQSTQLRSSVRPTARRPAQRS